MNKPERIGYTNCMSGRGQKAVAICVRLLYLPHMSDPNVAFQLSTALAAAREDAKVLGELKDVNFVLSLADRYAAFLLPDGALAKVNNSILQAGSAIAQMAHEAAIKAIEKTDTPAS